MKQKVRKKKQITFNSEPVTATTAPRHGHAHAALATTEAAPQQKTERFTKSQTACIGAPAVTTVAPTRALAGRAERKGATATQVRSARAQPPAAAIASHTVTTTTTTTTTTTASKTATNTQL